MSKYILALAKIMVKIAFSVGVHTASREGNVCNVSGGVWLLGESAGKWSSQRVGQ